MKQLAIQFDPTGTGHCLYSEMIPLQSIGSLQVRRATSIEFVDRVQLWEVVDPNGKLLFQSSSRQSCLDWEQVNL